MGRDEISWKEYGILCKIAGILVYLSVVIGLV